MAPGAGQRPNDTASLVAAQQADRRRAREARMARDQSGQQHAETVRAAALQAAVALLAPHWAPFAHADGDVVYCAEIPESFLIGGHGQESLDYVLALAERFERFIGEAGPDEDHPGLTGGWSGSLPQHPGLD